MENKYVLAMYDIRGKQEFIYRSGKIKEIMGASWIIRDLFKDYLYDAAIEYRNIILKKYLTEDVDRRKPDVQAIKGYDPNKETLDKFSFEEFETNMKSEQYIGEIVYDGGGNFILLFKSKEVAVGVTEIFTKKVLKNTGSLRVLCTYIEDINPDCYQSAGDKSGDYDRLYEKHRLTEGSVLVSIPYGTLPIVQTDPGTGNPLTAYYINTPNESGYIKLSLENQAKRTKYETEYSNFDENDKKILDEIVEETRGEDSMLAVFYIDGNNMGAKVQECLKEVGTTYDDCVNRLREFSKEIQKNFVDDRLNKLFKVKRRQVIGAGDEITVICRADESYAVIKEYLEDLPYPYSSCAGVAVFHSHAPFSDAYRIAEACCENCKRYMKKHGFTDMNLIDFEYLQGGIGLELEDIRRDNGDLDNSRPWRVERKVNKKETDVKDEQVVSVAFVERVNKILSLFGKSNVKGLLIPSLLSEDAMKTDIRRILAHSSKEKKQQILDEIKELSGKNDNDMRENDVINFFVENCKLVKDLIRVYDINFGKGI
ncbi:hypothetical protein [Lachnoanaerobaculum saburreum]|uniref:Uncharacterized protein n=1 Tax=Lachnoanaerobaculum saburreum DSM 3986 TaxID=887325 RepID=E6LNT2_9FIRM|nr:hypothetical protein [Lachnoanaerobaculum saburreum]EFU76498.1 hypothetical protein HMPREF0381_1617 [Lachnoanaerobaculum saburreum DSM 3986]